MCRKRGISTGELQQMESGGEEGKVLYKKEGREGNGSGGRVGRCEGRGRSRRSKGIHIHYVCHTRGRMSHCRQRNMQPKVAHTCWRQENH